MTESKPPFSELIERQLVTTEPLSPEQTKMVDEHMARREAVAKEMEEEKASGIADIVSPELKQAYSAYWGAQTREEERSAYQEILRLGGEDGYAAITTEAVNLGVPRKPDSESADVPPLALTDRNIAALSRAIEAEGYRIMVDPETGDVKLERNEGSPDGQ